MVFMESTISLRAFDINTDFCKFTYKEKVQTGPVGKDPQDTVSSKKRQSSEKSHIFVVSESVMYSHTLLSDLWEWSERFFLGI